MELFENHVLLRVSLLKKQIADYFQDVEKAVKSGAPIPLPGDEED